MARKGTTFEPNQAWFDTAMKGSKVRALTKSAAGRALGAAKASAPVGTGAYQRGLRLENADTQYRPVERVVGTDPKTLIIESKTGNLARAVKAAKR